MQSVLESYFMVILEGARFQMDFQPFSAPEKREVVELVTGNSL